MLLVEEVAIAELDDNEQKHAPTLNFETFSLTRTETKADLGAPNTRKTSDLSIIALSHTHSISDAIDMISAAKEECLSEKDKDELIKAVGDRTGCKTVGGLKMMAQEELSAIVNGLSSDELKVYWKCLLQQSCSLTPTQILECEFNFGLKLKFSSEDESTIEEVQSMGFQEEIAIEAWTVFNGKNLERMMNYALLPSSERYRQRYQAKKKFQRFVGSHRHWTVVENHLRSKANTDPKTKTMRQLQEEITKTVQELNATKQMQTKLKQAIDVAKHRNDLELFEYYLQGLISGNRLSNQKAARLPIERQYRQVSEEEYREILSDINEDEKSMENKRTQKNQTKGNHWFWKTDVCIVCLDKCRGICDRLFVPCNHCVICSPCYLEHYQRDLFDTNTKDGVVCPICRKGVVEIRKVFF